MCLDRRCVVFHRSVMSTTFWEWPGTYHPSGETYSSWSLERCSSWMSVTQKVIRWKLQVLLSEKKKNCNDKSLRVMLFRSALLGQILRTQSTQLWRTCRPSTRKRRDCLTWYQHHTFSDPIDCVSFAKMFYWFLALQYIQHTHTQQLLGLIQAFCFIYRYFFFFFCCCCVRMKTSQPSHPHWPWHHTQWLRGWTTSWLCWWGMWRTSVM